MASATIVALLAALATLPFSAGDNKAPQFTATTLLSRSGDGSPELSTLVVAATSDEVAARAAREIGTRQAPSEIVRDVEAVASDTDANTMEITATAASPDQAKTTADAFAASLVFLLRQGVKRATPPTLDPRAKEELRAELDALRRSVATERKRALREIAAADSVLEVDKITETLNLILDIRNGRIDELETRLGVSDAAAAAAAPLPRPVDLEVIEKARPHREASEGSRSGVRVAFAGIAGLLGGAVLALILEKLDPRVYREEDVTDLLGVPTFAIPSATEPATAPAPERALLLASAIEHQHEGEPPGTGDSSSSPSVVLVTSAANEPERPEVTRDLAAAFAEMGRKVVIVCCDWSHDGPDRMLEVSGSEGLATVLAAGNEAHMDGVVGRTAVEGVGIVTTGARPSDPIKLLASDSMKRFLERLRADADVIVLDRSALVSDGVALVLLPLADAAVVVTQKGVTRVGATKNAREALATNKGVRAVAAHVTGRGPPGTT